MAYTEIVLTTMRRLAQAQLLLEKLADETVDSGLGDLAENLARECAAQCDELVQLVELRPPRPQFELPAGSVVLAKEQAQLLHDVLNHCGFSGLTPEGQHEYHGKRQQAFTTLRRAMGLES